jgi:hypothetical protein
MQNLDISFVIEELTNAQLSKLNNKQRWAASKLYVNARSKNGLTVEEQLLNRRLTPKRSLTIQVKEQFTKVLQQKYPNIGDNAISLKWSRKAGCGCGCSPGYIIKTNDNANVLNVPNSILYGNNFNATINLN